MRVLILAIMMLITKSLNLIRAIKSNIKVVPGRNRALSDLRILIALPRSKHYSTKITFRVGLIRAV